MFYPAELVIQMFTKTKAIERPYSEAELKGLEKVFAELRKAGHSPSVKAYLRKRKAELKA